MDILFSAFNDELEKIAGLPRAVREGGGGVYGYFLRHQNRAGRRASKSVAESKAYQRSLDPYRGTKVPRWFKRMKHDIGRTFNAIAAGDLVFAKKSRRLADNYLKSLSSKPARGGGKLPG